MNHPLKPRASGTADKNENDDLTFRRYNLRFYGNESRLVVQDNLSGGRRARKLATFAPGKSYEGCAAKLLISIKGHCNSHKSWPLSNAIFIVSILIKLVSVSDINLISF